MGEVQQESGSATPAVKLSVSKQTEGVFRRHKMWKGLQIEIECFTQV